jgi:hypothetical protein
MTIIRSGRDTMLVAGVPRERGTPLHIEDGMAFTLFDGKTNRVEEIHTPHIALIRIHELMHARYTSQRKFNRDYSKLPDTAANFLEDVRLHVRHWPWGRENTPPSVQRAVNDYMTAETVMVAAALAEDPTKKGSWPDFATRLRIAAVTGALKGDWGLRIDAADFAPGQDVLARTIVKLMLKGRAAKAAKLVATAFFPASEPGEIGFGGGAGPGFLENPEDYKVMMPGDGFQQPEMEIIDLPKTEHVEGAQIGERRATMGSRMYRPALRRPLLPQRLFIRRTPTEPGGTILIDASGSMGDFKHITKWLKRAPFGQIAYYAGNGRSGWLWIFARDGRRAAKPPEPMARGNTVDGPALTWLMQQPGPRIFVTDRGFCDCPDSSAQVARLARLESDGVLAVENYNHTKNDEPDEEEEEEVD